MENITTTEQSARTAEEFRVEIARCREIFEKKTRDYGTSWRVLRLPSLTDQIYIKANRIRSIQESGENRVGDGVEPEFVAMVNYAVMALIQQELGPDEEQDLTVERALELYDKHINRAAQLMMDKNHDYGEAWRDMRVSSYTDIILTKLERIKEIEDKNGLTIASEGIDSNIMDIINYSVFAVIKLSC